jgi:NAD+ synthase (glutamine-hydrolysing)
MGAENVVFITQPSKNNGSRTLANAEFLSKNLGVELQYDPIIDYVEMYKEKNPDASKAQIASFEATFRKSLGFSYTHKNKSGIVACGNHTENVLGFFGFGDIGSMGVYQPIGDMTKTEIYDLARYINEEVEHKEIIPACLYDGTMKPAAELEDNNEDPFDYEIMSVICEKIIRLGETPDQIYAEMSTAHPYKKYTKEYIKENVDKAWVLSKRSVFKRAQSAPVLILSNRSIGFSSRETIINHYK